MERFNKFAFAMSCLLFLQQFAFSQDIGLKDVYANYFRFGSILNGTTVNNNAMKQLVLREFNSITPENELKPDATLVQSGSTNTDIKVSLSRAANILKFCEDNNIPMRGHTLVWHSQTPEWFFKENFQASGNWVTPAVMDQRMESYIKNMFEAIKNQYPNLNLYAYDVVNEASSESGGPRTAGTGSNESKWVQVYGNNSFVEKAFTYARIHAPETTKLFYNDYNEYIQAKRNYIADSIVKPLFAKGLLDGMGMQSHLDARDGSDAYPSSSLYKDAIKIYKNIGVEVQVTELDATVNSSNFNAQATYYENIMKAIVEEGGDVITAVVVWGIQDDQSWRKDRNPLLFDASGNKKAAYNSVVSVIPESEWGNGDDYGKPSSSSSDNGNSSSSSSDGGSEDLEDPELPPNSVFGKASLKHFSVRSLSNGILQIESDANTAIYIYDIKGNLALKKYANAGSNIVQMKAPGLYVLKSAANGQAQMVLVK